MKCAAGHGGRRWRGATCRRWRSQAQERRWATCCRWRLCWPPAGTARAPRQLDPWRLSWCPRGAVCRRPAETGSNMAHVAPEHTLIRLGACCECGHRHAPVMRPALDHTAAESEEAPKTLCVRAATQVTDGPRHVLAQGAGGAGGGGRAHAAAHRRPALRDAVRRRRARRAGAPVSSCLFLPRQSLYLAFCHKQVAPRRLDRLCRCMHALFASATLRPWLQRVQLRRWRRWSGGLTSSSQRQAGCWTWRMTGRLT